MNNLIDNERDFLWQIKANVNKRWKREYPEDFKCLGAIYASDYYSCNHCPNTWLTLVSSPKAKYNNVRLHWTDWDMNKYGRQEVLEERKRILADIENTESIKLWCIENFKITNPECYGEF